ncbi:MAG: hypothetical protein JJT78_10960 [Leptospira sp.]|nr:hypothetical protein [Leptospira sp.]
MKFKDAIQRMMLIISSFAIRNFIYRPSYLFIFMLICLSIQCSADKAKANEKKTEECRRLAFLQIMNNQNKTATSSEESLLLSDTNIKLSYSCSSESGDSPSCREFYSPNPDQVFLEEFCPTRYRKFKARCSRQNYVGECRILDSENKRYEKRIYARPNDDINEAKDDCLVAGGRFIDSGGEDLTLPLLLACELNAE